MPEDNPYLRQAKENLDIYLQLSVQFERAKSEKAKTIGVNKNKGKLTEAETVEMIKQREKL